MILWSCYDIISITVNSSVTKLCTYIYNMVKKRYLL